jgi:hypothetical protein
MTGQLLVVERFLEYWLVSLSWLFSQSGDEEMGCFVLLFASGFESELSSESGSVSGDGGTTTQRVVTFTLPLARFLTSHKSVSFFFMLDALSTVTTVGEVESFDLLDCILITFLNGPTEQSSTR